MSYRGEDGIERDLEAHRGHLRAYFDAAVNAAGGRYDEDYASALRGKLAALPKPPGRAESRAGGEARLHVILADPDDIRAWQAFRQDAGAQIRALDGDRLTEEASALLRALAARAGAVRAPDTR